MAKTKRSKAHEAAASLGDQLRVSDDAVVMAAVGGTSFIQVAMAMTPKQRQALVAALEKMVALVESLDDNGASPVQVAHSMRLPPR
jgi:hypothetical protein